MLALQHAAAEKKPIFVDELEKGEELRTLTKDQASELWQRNKYKGITFVDEDPAVPEHREVCCIKWVRGRTTGPIARRVQRGRHVVPIMNTEEHPEVGVEDDSSNEDHPIGEVVWPMARASAIQAKFRFKSQMPAWLAD